jgi:hypothetical protein
LIVRLEDVEVTVRYEAARALENIGDIRAVEELSARSVGCEYHSKRAWGREQTRNYALEAAYGILNNLSTRRFPTWEPGGRGECDRGHYVFSPDLLALTSDDFINQLCFFIYDDMDHPELRRVAAKAILRYPNCKQAVKDLEEKYMNGHIPGHRELARRVLIELRAAQKEIDDLKSARLSWLRLRMISLRAAGLMRFCRKLRKRRNTVQKSVRESGAKTFQMNSVLLIRPDRR